MRGLGEMLLKREAREVVGETITVMCPRDDLPRSNFRGTGSIRYFYAGHCPDFSFVLDKFEQIQHLHQISTIEMRCKVSVLVVSVL